MKSFMSLHKEIVLKDGSVQPFSENKVCIAIVSYLIFIKNSALAFAIYLLLLEMLLKSKKKKKNAEVDIRKKRGKNKNGKYTCKNVMH